MKNLTTRKKGAALLLTFIIMATLAAITAAFLHMTSIQARASGYDIAGTKALWLAEAGLEKAIWNLKTIAEEGGKGEEWITSGTTESLGEGNYTMVVERWDFALAENGASSSDDPEQPAPPFGPSKAIDGDDSTHWRSRKRPTAIEPQILIITFPNSFTINKVRFLSTNTESQPRDYTWEVSIDGVDYTTVVTKVDNDSIDVTDTFTAASNVNFLRLRATKAGLDKPSTRVRLATLEVIGSKIASTGYLGGIDRKIEQRVVADDATGSAFDENDWNEIVPAGL